MSEWVPTTCMRCAVGCGHVQCGVEKGYGILSKFFKSFLNSILNFRVRIIQ